MGLKKLNSPAQTSWKLDSNYIDSYLGQFCFCFAFQTKRLGISSAQFVMSQNRLHCFGPIMSDC